MDDKETIRVLRNYIALLEDKVEELKNNTTKLSQEIHILNNKLADARDEVEELKLKYCKKNKVSLREDAEDKLWRTEPHMIVGVDPYVQRALNNKE